MTDNLFGWRDDVPEVNKKGLHAIAKMLFKMAGISKKNPDLRETFANERYRRTMSDEYPFRKPTIDKFSRVPEEQKAEWLRLQQK